MKKHYPVIIEQDEDSVFIIDGPVFTGCRSYGYTIVEAMANIQEAVEACREKERTDTATTFIGLRDIALSAP